MDLSRNSREPSEGNRNVFRSDNIFICLKTLPVKPVLLRKLCCLE